MRYTYYIWYDIFQIYDKIKNLQQRLDYFFLLNVSFSEQHKQLAMFLFYYFQNYLKNYLNHFFHNFWIIFLYLSQQLVLNGSIYCTSKNKFKIWILTIFQIVEVKYAVIAEIIFTINYNHNKNNEKYSQSCLFFNKFCFIELR